MLEQLARALDERGLHVAREGVARRRRRSGPASRPGSPRSASRASRSRPAAIRASRSSSSTATTRGRCSSCCERGQQFARVAHGHAVRAELGGAARVHRVVRPGHDLEAVPRPWRDLARRGDRVAQPARDRGQPGRCSTASPRKSAPTCHGCGGMLARSASSASSPGCASPRGQRPAAVAAPATGSTTSPTS